MTRVLQIRRGTAAQHKNFVGMPGEITMDTDNKTIRLHDGITLGGITVGTGGNGNNNTADFDINSVPDEFWADIVAKHMPATFKVIETKQITFTNNSAGKELVVGGNDIPKFIQTVLVCQSAEAGYSVGDEVWSWGIGNRANPNPQPAYDQDGLRIKMMINNEAFWVNHKNTGAKTSITDTNWRILYRVYC